MKSLFAKFYFSVVGLIVLFAFAAFGAWHYFGQPEPRAGGNRWITELAREKLPATLNTAELNAQLERWRHRMRADLVLVDGQGKLLGSSGEQFEIPDDFVRWRVGREDGWFKAQATELQEKGRYRDRGWVYGIALDGGERWMFMRRLHSPSGRSGQMGPFGPNPLRGFAMALTAIVLIMALASYPLLRRLTRRLEQMDKAVARFGAGDLSARVEVSGSDELGKVSATFNQAASQLETLIQAQRSLLANASHELRSPLARLKMAVSLSGDHVKAELRDEMDRNVAELDTLVDEILLSSRLEALQAGAGGWQLRKEPLDMVSLVRLECDAANVDLLLETQSILVQADVRLLRRLTRNLLENARRYAPDGSTQVRLTAQAGQLVMQVLDQGPGIEKAVRERIFEPFYRLAGASESAGGVGLGLSLVRQIAHSHGGTVQCLDRPDGLAGSCFEFRMALGGGS
jgi:signal transduction histidine kinase